MFYYYGRKKMLAGRYPEPKYDTVIEPFAGSAAYSLHGSRWKKRVILYDRSDIVGAIWPYLLTVGKDRLESLPNPAVGEDLKDHPAWDGLREAERLLIGLHTGVGKPSRRSKINRFSRWKPGKRYLLENLEKVQGGNWEFHGEDYQCCDWNGPATWFIDPPYPKVGEVYPRVGRLCYRELADWVLSRPGQVIVCGSADDAWLPFRLLGVTKSAGRKKSAEGVYLGGKQRPGVDWRTACGCRQCLTAQPGEG